MMRSVLLRLKEPSTYAGLAALLSAIGFSFNADVWTAIASTAMGVAGLAAVFLPEDKTKD